MKVLHDKFMACVERYISENIASRVQGKDAEKTQFALGAGLELKRESICEGLKNPLFYDSATNTVDVDKIERVIMAGFKMSKNNLPIPLRFNFLDMEIDLGGTIHMKPEDWTNFKRML